MLRLASHSIPLVHGVLRVAMLEGTPLLPTQEPVSLHAGRLTNNESTVSFLLSHTFSFLAVSVSGIPGGDFHFLIPFSA